MIKTAVDELNEQILQLHSIEYATTDANGRILTTSPHFCRWLETPPLTIIGCHISDLFIELSGLEEEVALLAQQNGPPLKIEKIHRCSLQGEPQYVTLTLASFGEGLLLTAVDVTQEGHLEQRITQQRNELGLMTQKLSRAYDELDKLLHRFLPDAVADQFIANPQMAQLGGERRIVSVLFADIRGFTSWTEGVLPEEALHMLNGKLGLAVDAILTHGGTIDKFMGDAVMGIFNAPNSHLDHAMQAVRAGWALIQSLRDETRLQFSVGINTGTAVAGNIGTSQIMNYTVIGDAVNQAKRLQEMAKPGQMLISGETYRAARSEVDAISLGEHQLRGRSKETEIYFVTNLSTG